MRVFLFSAWMIIALRHLRPSSSLSFLSNFARSHHRTITATSGKHNIIGGRASPVSILSTNSETTQRSGPFRYLQKHRRLRTIGTMIAVAQHNEIESVGTTHGEIADNPSVSAVSARLVPQTELKECGERLRSGGLVAFPTETVYGLGCNALDPEAITKVFEAKERPLTDPLITHVTDPNIAFGLWDAVDKAKNTASPEAEALRALCECFWPGPLTLVARAAPKVPPILMAGTGFCACRSPGHPLSIALIDAAGVPIAAPSANKFGHVSPTRSSHVWDDLKHEDVWIVEEEPSRGHETEADAKAETNCCKVGVESSVAKVEMIGETKTTGRVTLLRQGAVSLKDIVDCLKKAGLAEVFEVVAMTKKATKDTVANVAPGQTIRHYSPDIPSFILSLSLCEALVEPSSDEDRELLGRSVLIDFGGRLRAWKPFSLAYRDLSPTRDSSEATQGVFEALRWAERIEGASQILFPEISGEAEQDNALALALKDRLTRAASGVVVDSLGEGMNR